jgi:hypothetical protein
MVEAGTVATGYRASNSAAIYRLHCGSSEELMSLPQIRRALEKHLAALTPAVPTAWDNVTFSPPADGSVYQEVKFVPNEPNGEMMDTLTFIEQGLLQVSVFYPQGKGPRDSDNRVDALRSHFRRGTTLVEGGVSTIITRVPSVAAGLPMEGQWRVPVTIYWQAQVNS